ncbi:hypothetical protein O0L34_g5850 [Tuta absoluta]|nr:hypothetical protein O0L34_g5850 [Tuta absoluta]
MSDVYDALNKLCDTMKTSSYDEKDNFSAETTTDEQSYEAPVADNEASVLTYEESVAQSYEASFAKCKVATSHEVDTSHEGLVAEVIEATFAKCALAPVTESSEEIIEDYETPNSISYDDSFARCSLPPVTETLETSVETHESPIVEISETQPVVKHEAKYEAQPAGNEIQTSNLTSETYTSSLPPPVPKRTLLPKTTNETGVAKVTSVVKEEKTKEKVEAQESFVVRKQPTKDIANQETSRPDVAQEIPTEEVEVQNVGYRDIELVSPEDVVQKVETGTERWSDTTSVSLPGQVEDIETVSSDPGKYQSEPASEMYYTASSEVSLLSTEDDENKDDRKNVISGHVAAMRERFESMTRTNTPCPDLARSLSPSLEVFRNLSPSPDRLT